MSRLLLYDNFQRANGGLTDYSRYHQYTRLGFSEPPLEIVNNVVTADVGTYAYNYVLSRVKLPIRISFNIDLAYSSFLGGNYGYISFSFIDKYTYDEGEVFTLFETFSLQATSTLNKLDFQYRSRFLEAYNGDIIVDVFPHYMILYTRTSSSTQFTRNYIPNENIIRSARLLLHMNTTQFSAYAKLYSLKIEDISSNDVFFDFEAPEIILPSSNYGRFFPFMT